MSWLPPSGFGGAGRTCLLNIAGSSWKRDHISRQPWNTSNCLSSADIPISYLGPTEIIDYGTGIDRVHDIFLSTLKKGTTHLDLAFVPNGGSLGR